MFETSNLQDRDATSCVTLQKPTNGHVIYATFNDTYECITSLNGVKLKLKLTPFDIAHHSKGNPFQVRLTVSTDYISQRYNVINEKSVTHISRRG